MPAGTGKGERGYRVTTSRKAAATSHTKRALKEQTIACLITNKYMALLHKLTFHMQAAWAVPPHSAPFLLSSLLKQLIGEKSIFSLAHADIKDGGAQT